MSYPGLIAKGSGSAESIRLLQAQLVKLGYGPLEVNGQFDRETEDAVVRFQSQHVDQMRHALIVDGRVGPLTWQSLFGGEVEVPAAAPSQGRELALKALELALGEEGVREDPVGSNSGPRVDQYLLAAGSEPGQFWCMAFCYWAVGRAAKELQIPVLMPRSASCPRIWNWAVKAKKSVAAALVESAQAPAEPGQLFFVQGKIKGVVRPFHVGFVVRQEGGYVRTIEGNTNTDGSRNGVGVFLRTRKVSSLLGFVEIC